MVIDGGGITTVGVNVQDDYTYIEELELKGFRKAGSPGSAAVRVDATNVLLEDLLIHDFFEPTGTSNGIKPAPANPAANYTIRNCIIYDGYQGILLDNGGIAMVENCSIYGMTSIGVRQVSGSMTATNTISMGNVTADFSGTITQSCNLSSDATASGTGSIAGKLATDQFVSTSAGTEDLHLKAGADAINAGTDLSGSFTDDIDGETRPIATYWDMGADETQLAPYIWDGGGVDANWNTPQNWSTDVVPGAGDVAIFNSICATSCLATINVDPNVAGIDIQADYTGTITQSAGIATTVGASGYIQAAGTFVGGNSTIDLNGPFTLSGGSFTSTSGTMSISRDMTISGGTFAHNSGNVTFDSGTHRTVDIGTAILNDVTLAKSTFDVTVTGTMDVNGTLRITTVGSINTGTIAVAGNVITTDTLVNGSGTILFDGTGAQTLQVDGAGGSGGVPSVRINRTAGTLTIQDTINVSRDWTYMAGTVDAGTSTVAFSNTGPPSVTVDSGAMAFNNVTLAKGSFSVTVTGTMDVNGNLTIASVRFDQHRHDCGGGECDNDRCRRPRQWHRPV